MAHRAVRLDVGRWWAAAADDPAGRLYICLFWWVLVRNDIKVCHTVAAAIKQRSSEERTIQPLY
jgi:hypothetical protein